MLGIDAAPTLLELADVAPPSTMQGRSLVPIFEGTPGEWRDSFLIEYFTDTVFPRVRNMGYTAVRTRTHKYIEYRELERMNELYDLETDPHERRNLVDDSAARPALDRLQTELAQLLTDTKYSTRAR